MTNPHAALLQSMRDHANNIRRSILKDGPYAKLFDRAAEEIEALQQFKEWAEPQCEDYAANRMEIEGLRANLDAGRAELAWAMADGKKYQAECDRLRKALDGPREVPEIVAAQNETNRLLLGEIQRLRSILADERQFGSDRQKRHWKEDRHRALAGLPEQRFPSEPRPAPKQTRD